eukprot:gene889-4153_t
MQVTTTLLGLEARPTTISTQLQPGNQQQQRCEETSDSTSTRLASGDLNLVPRTAEPITLSAALPRHSPMHRQAHAPHNDMLASISNVWHLLHRSVTWRPQHCAFGGKVAGCSRWSQQQVQVQVQLLAAGDLEEELLDENRFQHIKSGTVQVPRPWFSFRTLWAYTGPGWLMSIAYLDPGNIEADLQAGAIAGYKLLWVVLWATIVGLIFQVLAARIGVSNGRHLAQICREAYHLPAKLTLWIMMEIAIIASDVQEVIGSAIAINILSNNKVPLWAGSLITAADTFTFLFLEAYGLRKLEALFATLVLVMSITFGYMYVASGPDSASVARGMVMFNASGAVNQAVGMIGAIIMPHNLYLHSALSTSRAVNRRDKRIVDEANKYNAIESGIALFVSFIINVFVVSVFAKAFFGTAHAEDIDLVSSGTYISEHFGTAVKYIWAVGLLAAGQSSTMTGTYAGQFVMEGFLRLHMAPWKRVALTRSLAMVPTVAIAVLTDTRTLNGIFQWMNVLQSFQLPFALFPLLHFVSYAGIMGHRKLSGWPHKIVWALCLFLLGVNMYLLVQTLDGLATTWYYDLLLVLFCIPYFGFTVYIIIGPFLSFGGMTHFSKLVLTPINSYLHDDDDDVLMEGGDGQNDDLEPLITHMRTTAEP